MKKLKLKIILALVILCSAITYSFVPALALDCSSSDAKVQIQCGACEAAGTAGSACKPTDATGSLSDTITSVVTVASIIAGAVAVLMIVIGGFRYVTSSGNPEATKGAKNTILFALIGLVVIALAQIIVRFVLHSVTT